MNIGKHGFAFKTCKDSISGGNQRLHILSCVWVNRACIMNSHENLLEVETGLIIFIRSSTEIISTKIGIL